MLAKFEMEIDNPWQQILGRACSAFIHNLKPDNPQGFFQTGIAVVLNLGFEIFGSIEGQPDRDPSLCHCEAK